jgi:hypothetical protein
MADDKAPLQPEEEEVNSEQVENTEDGEEKMIPKSRMDRVIEQREAFKSKLEESTSKLTSLEETVKKLQESIESQNKANSGVAFTDEEKQALDKIDKGLRERGYVTREEQEAMARIQNRNAELTRLTDKYKKGTGYPVFKADEVMIYAEKKGFGDNLEAAYRDLHFDAFIQAELDRTQGTGTQPPDSEKPIGGARDAATQVTRKAIAEMTPAEYEQHRESLLKQFKSSATGR